MYGCARCCQTITGPHAEAQQGTVTAYYHDDENAQEVTCYQLSRWAGFPELDALTWDE